LYAGRKENGVKRITDDIAGRFTRVSRTTYQDGTVLVAFCGSLYPHDLTADQISYIKTFYNMPNAEHEFFNEWPDGIEPAYAIAKTNYKNGYMLIRRV
jgi:hypothetical protein